MSTTETSTKPEVGYALDSDTRVYWFVIGAERSADDTDRGTLPTRSVAARAAKARAKRSGGIYIGDLDRRRDFGASAAFDLDDWRICCV